MKSFAIILLLLLFSTSCKVKEGTDSDGIVKEKSVLSRIDVSGLTGTRRDSIETKGSGGAVIHYELPRFRPESGEVILKHLNYTVSFNNQENIPFWVAWELNAEKLIERESRGNTKFQPDPDLGINELNTEEYKGSGWDRGHMCPAGDNRWHWKAMTESFYTTNICPQHHNLNRGDWKELEEKCREWAKVEPVYIACGAILYDEPKYGYIGKLLKIRIPDAFFKVLLTGLKYGSPRAIGFIYKNEAGNNKLDKYVNSVDQVERITKLDFFYSLPDDVEEKVEAEYDLNNWR